MLFIGIDIGGTKIAAGLVSVDGEIESFTRIPTPATSGAELEDAIVGLVQDLDERGDVAGVGVAVPGFIDERGSTVYYAPNVAWRAEPLRATLGDRLNTDVTIENDANAAGWAEYRFGAGRGFRHMTMLTLGTGVGGAIIADGHLLRGGFGSAGELGHIRVAENGLECGCGAHGCLEQYGSGRALLRIVESRARDLTTSSRLSSIVAGDGHVDPDDVRHLLEEGDPDAHAALREVGMWVGRGCASIAAVLDPQIFVIGGGLSVAGKALLDPIHESFRAEMSARGFHPEPEFAIAELGNNAGVIGAADLARTRSRLD